jgi:GNAT superfamily N-acetyltransferase
VDEAAERLLPRCRLDVALAAVGPTGALAAVVNANLLADDDETFELAILVAPEWRGRGLAATLLRAAVELLPTSATASGVIGRDNTPALSLLHNLAPTATVTLDPDSVSFRVSRDFRSGSSQALFNAVPIPADLGEPVEIASTVAGSFTGEFGEHDLRLALHVREPDGVAKLVQ